MVVSVCTVSSQIAIPAQWKYTKNRLKCCKFLKFKFFYVKLTLRRKTTVLDITLEVEISSLLCIQNRKIVKNIRKCISFNKMSLCFRKFGSVAWSLASEFCQELTNSHFWACTLNIQPTRGSVITEESHNITSTRVCLIHEQNLFVTFFWEWTLDEGMTSTVSFHTVGLSYSINVCSAQNKIECGPMPNVTVALPNIGGALCSTPQSLADAHY